MQFQACIEEGHNMREFLNVILTLSKLTKICIIEITSEKLRFIANEETNCTSPLVWMAIDVNIFFAKYLLNTNKSSDSDNILLSVSPVHLCRAVSALKSNARNCNLKLVHLQFDCLRIEVDDISQGADHVRQLVHDVPVTIIPFNEWNLYNLPHVPESSLIVNVTSHRLMRNLVEKMSNLSPSITFSITSTGEMNLITQTEMATIKTCFKNMLIKVKHYRESETDNERTDGLKTSCSIDCKKLSIFFSSLHVTIMEFYCGIEDDRFIHLKISVQPGVYIHSLFQPIEI